MIHVKMLDKDGVGFRHITVENPACIQLIASDPEIGDHPILRVGRENPNIVNYPLTNDAYIMSETGATISKINFKDCLREVGKEEGGWRPTRRGLKDLMPFNEINRNAVKTLFLKMPEEVVDAVRMGNMYRDTYIPASESFSGRKSPYEPYLVDVDADINIAEAVGDDWVFSINGKLRNVADFSPEDLSKMRVAYPHHKREEFIEDLAASKNSIVIQDFKDCVSVLSRNTRLHEYHMTVLGGTLKSAELFTPVIFDEELGGGLHVMIKGVRTSLDHVTMGDVLMHNMFFMEPLLVDQKTIEQDPAVIKQLMMASTVFFYAHPELRNDALKTQEWIDYAFTEEKKEWTKLHTPGSFDRIRHDEELGLVKEPLVFPEPTTLVFNLDKLFNRMYLNGSGGWGSSLDGSSPLGMTLSNISTDVIVAKRVCLLPEDLLEFNSYVERNAHVLSMDKLFNYKVDMVKAIGKQYVKARNMFGPGSGHELAFHPVFELNGVLHIAIPGKKTELLKVEDLSIAQLVYYRAYLPFGNQYEQARKALSVGVVRQLEDMTMMLKVLDRRLDGKVDYSNDKVVLDHITSLGLVKEDESLEMLSYLSNDLKGAFHEKVKECFEKYNLGQVIEAAVIKVNVGLAVKETYDNVAIIVDGEAVWVANASGLVSDAVGHATYMLKGQNEVSWFEIIPRQDGSKSFLYKNVKNSKSKAVFYSKTRILEIGTPCAVSNVLEDGEDIRQVTVERVHFKGSVKGKEVTFTVFTGQFSNNTFAPSVHGPESGIYNLNMVVVRMEVDGLQMDFSGYTPLISFNVAASFNTRENKLVISGNKVKVDGLAKANGVYITRANDKTEYHEVMNYFANGEVTQVDVKVISN